MAKSKAKQSRRASNARTSQDAIALLKADHGQVKTWFAEFQSARAKTRKATLAASICHALTVHTVIEEEIFYPAFLEATDEEDIHHEAAIEHDNAKKMIAEIEASTPDDDYYDAKMKVLSEMIKHHVNEEEKRDGMFAKAKASKMDLQSIGEQLAARKAELEQTQPAGSARANASNAKASREANSKLM